MKLRPIAKWLVQIVLRSDRAEALLGDLEEERGDVARAIGEVEADRRYFREALIAVVYSIGRSIVKSFGLQILQHAAALAGFWLVSTVLMRIVQHALPGWRASELALLSACVFGVLLSLRLRAHLAAFLFAGQVAFGVSEFAMHSTYSIRAVQGAPNHFAVMIAATIGVVLGAVLLRLIAPRPSVPAT